MFSRVIYFFMTTLTFNHIREVINVSSLQTGECVFRKMSLQKVKSMANDLDRGFEQIFTCD